MKKIIYIFYTIVLMAFLASCNEDSLEPTLALNKDVETSIKTLEDLDGVLRGGLNRMTQSTYYGRDYIIYAEVMSDNCYANGNSGRFVRIAQMDLLDTDAYATDTWRQIYRVIASANIIIGKENEDIEGDATMIKHIIGQAYIMRALAHFDLVRLYGQQHVTGGNNLGVPYMFEYKGSNIVPSRNTADEIKTFAINDLNTALTLMSTNLDDNSKEYFTTHSANALKARIALYFKDWPTVMTACESVINSGKFSIVPEANFVNSWVVDGAINSIFELAFSVSDNQAINGLQQIYRGSSYGDIRVLEDLVNSFDAGDVRNSEEMIALEYNQHTNMGKYPSSVNFSDNVSILRYEEVILNYAEALFRQNPSDPNALTYLNMVPANRGAQAYTEVNEDNILLERRREFCFEGFRFHDLARTGRDIPEVDPINQRHGGPEYGSYNYAFPIPISELNANGNMVQNQGY